MPSYHISYGNSEEGALSLCAQVKARTREKALQKIQKFLFHHREWKGLTNNSDIEYISIHIDPDQITLANVNEWEPEKEGMDPELLYYDVVEYIKSKGCFIPDEVDDQLGELCRAIAEGTDEQDG